MSNFLRSIDRIGKEFKFTINREESFTTAFGGIITIIYYLGYIGLFCFFGKELIIKEDPNFIERIDIKDVQSYVPVNDTNFYLSVGIIDWSENVIFDKTYFEVKLIYTEYTATDINNSFIDAINCADNEVLNSTEKERFNNHHCFNTNMEVGGYWGEYFTKITSIYS